MRVLAALVAMAALVGCSRTSSSTVVDANGDWHRTVKLTVTKGMSMGAEGAKDDEWPSPFKLPTEAGWTKTEKIKDDEKTTTLTRDCQAGDTLLTDVVLRDEKSKETMLKNFVRVREIEPGVFEYYEKIVNPNPEKFGDNADITKFKAELEKSLPEGVKVEEAEAEAVSKQMVVSISRIMFGPEDHLFGTLITNPEGAIRRLKLGLGKSLDAALKQHLSAKLNEGQRKELVAKMMSDLDADSIKESKKAEAAPGGKSDSTFTGMSVSVKLPGEIISSNGEVDPYTGEVFWDFLSASAGVEPLELRAVCRIKK